MIMAKKRYNYSIKKKIPLTLLFKIVWHYHFNTDFEKCQEIIMIDYFIVEAIQKSLPQRGKAFFMYFLPHAFATMEMLIGSIAACS